jgi:hypothetical protein
VGCVRAHAIAFIFPLKSSPESNFVDAGCDKAIFLSRCEACRQFPSQIFPRNLSLSLSRLLLINRSLSIFNGREKSLSHLIITHQKLHHHRCFIFFLCMQNNQGTSLLTLPSLSVLFIHNLIPQQQRVIYGSSEHITSKYQFLIAFLLTSPVSP